jgi:hypothetical protein
LTSSAGGGGYHSSGSGGLGSRGGYPPHLTMSHPPLAPRSPLSPSHSQHSPNHSPLHPSSGGSRDSRKRRAPPLSSYNSPSIVRRSYPPTVDNSACACAVCRARAILKSVSARRAVRCSLTEVFRHPRRLLAVADPCPSTLHTLRYGVVCSRVRSSVVCACARRFLFASVHLPKCRAFFIAATARQRWTTCNVSLQYLPHLARCWLFTMSFTLCSHHGLARAGSHFPQVPPVHIPAHMAIPHGIPLGMLPAQLALQVPGTTALVSFI